VDFIIYESFSETFPKSFLPFSIEIFKRQIFISLIIAFPTKKIEEGFRNQLISYVGKKFDLLNEKFFDWKPLQPSMIFSNFLFSPRFCRSSPQVLISKKTQPTFFSN
jgi:hypothetical protein